MNKFQKAAAATFSNGEHSHVQDLTQADKVGDTLFLFILRELEDVEDAETASSRIDRAVIDLMEVGNALELVR
ncbi:MULTISPECIES: hypothetical protein [unclassified Mesorhizobium]|uniref:hypothetical protein n=1 Tax=unclassified Mesorhizobium TaxID=325217 RepID=UPI00112A70D1|nr:MULTISPECIES: hypothetical protein [unclassified Mesorhizobium]TPJ51777.1 hypothetical protein FJ426_18910 [Mesorhizobium sp. B2-6-4]TPN42399.1 hypothetical protein FJ979_02325 [Mesorhizobium sp. B1-1-6]